MMEAVQMAQERQAQLAKLIKQREAEIEAYREEAAKIDMYVDLTKELFGRPAPKPASVQPQPVSTAQVQKVRPERHSA